MTASSWWTEPTDATQRLWGCGDLSVAFPGDRRVLTWCSAPRTRGGRYVAEADVARLLAGPPRLADLDPRVMLATQPAWVASHVAYYLTAEWPTTGRTSADQHLVSNRYPLVWIDDQGRQILLGGHHRSMAALIQGRPVRCRVLSPGTADDNAVAVLPLLLVGTATTLAGAKRCDASADASARVRSGRTALVGSMAEAEATLVELGLPAEIVADRLRLAAVSRSAVPAR